MNSSLELSREESSSFKFPFTDTEDADLKLSEKYGKVRRSLRLLAKSRSGNDGPSSELDLELSPIAKDGAETISIIGYVEGDSLCLGSISSVESEESMSQIPLVDNLDGKELMEGQEISELPKMTIPQAESLESAMKQVGERSNDFIHKMRDAASKRKAAVTRSRDFLVAREQEQIRSIEEFESRLTTLKQKLENTGDINKENESFQQFRKKSNKSKMGFGGIGVPKVQKRPTTKALSPKLGLRRNGEISQRKSKDVSGRDSAFRPVAKSTDIKIYHDTEGTKSKISGSPNQIKRYTTKKALDEEAGPLESRSNKNEEQQESSGIHGGLKSRRVQSSKAQRWNAGQFGIPKVSKRAVTVPVSPCIGSKRQTRIAAERNGKIHDGKQKSKNRMNTSKRSSGFSTSSRSIAMSPSSVQGSPLIGLNLIDSIRKESVTITKEPEIENNMAQRRRAFKPFVPRSTYRASMRKQYDIYQGETRALSIQQKREQLQSQIKTIRRELKVLGKDLT